MLAITVTATGQVTYEKRVYTRPSTNLDESTSFVALPQARIQAESEGNVLATTTTDDNGNFSFSVTFTATYKIVAYSSNSSIAVGTNLNTNNAVTGIYSQATSLTSSAGPHQINISESQNSGAFNIFAQLVRGQKWFSDHSLTFTRNIKAIWPNGTGTFFTPSLFSISLLGITGNNTDPDEFDDDIILHEFGHMAAEEFSLDHSAGGPHSITSHVDLRLAWSEGLATYLSSAIRNDSVNLDSSGGTTSNKSNTSSFDINTPPSSITESSNEWAVAYILWKAQQQTGSASSVLNTITSFKSLPSSLLNEQISLDTFHDLWSGSSLSTPYQDRKMAYHNDAISESNTIPLTISTSTQVTSLTFFPNADIDYFQFSSKSGDTFAIETKNTGNGALTSLKLFQGNVSSNVLVTSNDQATNSTSDTTSKIEFTASADTLYTIAVERFQSQSKNFGPGGTSYSKTAGRYGNYDLSFIRNNAPIPVPTLTSQSSQAAGEEALSILLTNNTGSSLIQGLDDFSTAVGTGEKKQYTNLNSNTYMTVINVTDSNEISHHDSNFSISVSNVPTSKNLVMTTLPLTIFSTLPSGSTGKLIALNLKDGSTEVTTGFTIPLKLSGRYNSNKTQSLYVQQSDQTFKDSGFTAEKNGNDLVFNLSHFSVYALIESDATSSTSSSIISNAASGGGGGGGCFLKIKTQ